MSDPAITPNPDGTVIEPPEMVAVSRAWVLQRVEQFKDETTPVQTWAWRVYRELLEIAEFESAEIKEGADDA